MGGLPEIGSVPKMTVAEIKAIMHTNGVHVPSGKKAVVVEALQEWLRKQVASGGNNTNEVVSTAMPDMQASHPHVDGVDMIDSSMSDASQAEQGVPVPDAPIQQQQDNGDTHGTDISAAQVHSDEGAVAMDTQVHTNVTGHDPHNDVNGDATHDGVSGRGTHVHVESGMIDDSTRVAQSDVSSAVDGDEEPPLGVQMPVHTPTLHTHTKPKSTIKEKSEEGVPVNSVNGSVNISEEPSQSTVDTSTAEAGEAHDADRTNGSEATQSDNTQTATTQPQTQTDTPAHTHLPTQTHAPDTLSNMTSQAQDAPTETQAETQVFVAPLPVPNVSTKPTLSPTLTPTQPQATPATAAAAAPAPAPAAAPAPAPAPAAAPAAAPAPAPAPVAATTQTKKKGKKKKIKQKLHQRLAAAEEELRANKEKVESWREAESASNGVGATMI
ncbi:hypothetical protein SARC_09434 [Sphaeroforma arctica JP610]|uniref:Uncharacterized protein n=1 Tax=Sphaeroforma arctica JP610 TaxID=667725 RepID=A0A0L0FMZ5_9EUKA|nr:hypothetical protein SARC_09434 [Sphaeroforma arctica JP610]KNC78127.1 hypothetical protein SARC_09434 [Sphaeroforma arctica JP610]|eukprot:XP_014152029.1 hypothetical protein SARC_09434 [Sphaeroforma arctica JP610]